MTRIERYNELIKTGIKPKAAEGIIRDEVRTTATLKKEQAKLGVSLSQSQRKLESERKLQQIRGLLDKEKAEIKRIRAERFKGSFLGRTAASTMGGIASASRNTQKFARSREGRKLMTTIRGRKPAKRRRKSSGDGFFGEGGGDSGGFF